MTVVQIGWTNKVNVILLNYTVNCTQRDNQDIKMCVSKINILSLFNVTKTLNKMIYHTLFPSMYT